ncbi:hypothetical protein [Sutcliffiella halmapala]|uniref:hypothetical protein n=1 Tax=Sutcliffiella halmapala TaxID=79882 RepID=UPI00099518F6|nr:hypothetical protein [Sutcliffiella halmapala]
MKFEFKSFKVDILMNSSSLNKGENHNWNTKAQKRENEGLGTIAGDRNRISNNTNTVNNNNVTDSQNLS